MRLPDLRRPRNSSVHWPGSDRGARATQGNTSAGHSGRQLEDSPLSPRCSPSARCCLVAHWRRGGPLHKERLGTTCRLRNSRAALRGRAVVRLAPRIRRASHQQRSSREGHPRIAPHELHLFSSLRARSSARPSWVRSRPSRPGWSARGVCVGAALGRPRVLGA
jgi:hypothetical protein